MRAYLTPDSLEGEQIGLCITLPVHLSSYVRGALSELEYSYNWEQYGLASPDDTAEFFREVVSSVGQGCGMKRVAIVKEVNPSKAMLKQTYSNLDLESVFDPYGMVNPVSPGGFDIPETGYYRIVVRLFCSPPSGDPVRWTLYSQVHTSGTQLGLLRCQVNEFPGSGIVQVEHVLNLDAGVGVGFKIRPDPNTTTTDDYFTILGGYPNGTIVTIERWDS